jgi:hypothetical protein
MELFPETPDATIDSAQNLALFTSLGRFMKLSTALAIELGGGDGVYLTSHRRI